MTTKRTVIAFLATLVLTVTLPAVAQTKWDVSRTMPIGGDGAWD